MMVSDPLPILSDVSSKSLCKDLQDHIHGNSIIQCTNPKHRLAILQLYHGVVADSHGNHCHDDKSESCVTVSSQSLLDTVKSDCDGNRLNCEVQAEWFQEPESCTVTGSPYLKVDYTCIQGKIWLWASIYEQYSLCFTTIYFMTTLNIRPKNFVPKCDFVCY